MGRGVGRLSKTKCRLGGKRGERAKGERGIRFDDMGRTLEDELRRARPDKLLTYLG